MPDGTTPVIQAGNQTLIQILTSLEVALNRDERGDALELNARAKELALRIALTAPCPDCGSTDTGHATPCGKRAAGTIEVRALVRALSVIADDEEARRMGDISYGLDGVAALLQQVCESMDPAVVAKDAAALEVSHG